MVESNYKAFLDRLIYLIPLEMNLAMHTRIRDVRSSRHASHKAPKGRRQFLFMADFKETCQGLSMHFPVRILLE